MRKTASSVGFTGAEGGVRPVGVVLDAPALDGDLSPEQGVALFDGQQLVSEGLAQVSTLRFPTVSWARYGWRRCRRSTMLKHAKRQA